MASAAGFCTILGVILVLSSSVIADEEARILASKFLLSSYGITDTVSLRFYFLSHGEMILAYHFFLVEYCLYNVAEKPAIKDSLIDYSFPSHSFISFVVFIV